MKTLLYTLLISVAVAIFLLFVLRFAVAYVQDLYHTTQMRSK
jgi:hypothetical protein